MLTPKQADNLRNLITRYAPTQYQAGRLNWETDMATRARVLVAADVATTALCAELSALTLGVVEGDAEPHQQCFA